jgi:2-octaprenylphenol hydroxylase
LSLSTGAFPPPVEMRAMPVDLRVFALSRASEKILRAADAWADVAAVRAAPYERMQVWHADVPPHGGDALVFDAAEIGERDLGVIAENNVLQAALLAAARRAGVVLEQGELESLERERSAMVLRTAGAQLRARLVIGADGAQSRVRELAGLFARRTDYGQLAIVAMVGTAKPHQNTAWQRFLGDGTLAFLPLADGSSSIVWSVPTARAEKTAGRRAARVRAATRTRLRLGARRGAPGQRALQLPAVASVGGTLCERARGAGGRRRARGASARGAGREPGLVRRRGSGRCPGRGIEAREDLGAERILRRYERWRRSENELMSAAIDAFDRAAGARQRPRRRGGATRTCRGCRSRAWSSARSSSAPWAWWASCPAAAR